MYDQHSSVQTVASVEEPAGGRAVWRDLQTKGYVVVPSFLSGPEIQFLIEAFESANSFANAATYRMVSSEVVEAFRPKLAQTVAAIGRETDLRVDLLTGSVYFAIKLGTDLGWHQDHESFYQFGDHYHYLNFYIPFKKPVREKSNLSVIPLDELAKRSPKVYERRKGKGACVASSFMGRTILQDHDRGGYSALSFNFDEIGVTPELGPGDLLLLRGDVFHKTQDTDTDRIAISFRMVNSKTIVRRSSLVSFGVSLEKFLLHSKNKYRRSRYQDWSQVFEEAHTSQLCADEYLSILNGIESRGDKQSQGSWMQFFRAFQRNWISS
jgi:hypothetical protein